MIAYSSSREHLLAEIDRIDAIIRLCVWRARQATGSAELLQTTGGALDDLLSGPGGLPSWSSSRAEPTEKWSSGWDAICAELRERREESLRSGVPLRFVELCRRFGLTPLDADIVLLCLASEVDLRYEEVFALLQGDSTRRRLSVDLALNLLSSSLEEKLDATSRFFSDAPLVRHAIVRLLGDDGRLHAPWLASTLKLDERIVRHLFDSDEVDPSLAPFVRRVRRAPRHEPAFAAARVDELARELARCGGVARSLLVHLREPCHGDGLDVASAACARVGREVLAVDGEHLAALPDPPAGPLSLLLREAVLRGAALFLGDAGARMPRILEALARELPQLPGGLAVFVSRDAPWEPEPSERVDFVEIDVPTPNGVERAALWREALPGFGAEIDAVAAKFRFSAAQIRGAAAGARRRARLRGDEDAPAVDDVYDACRGRSSHAVDQLARRIRPRYRWDDLVLAEDAVRQLREICDRVTHRGRVLDEWGFAGKLSLGRGLNVLFAGPSGTGKTMAAEIIAGALRLDLYRIDLSSVVSKYIGETEKNLSQIFAAAETSNAILFFDEADALFGKRSEVKDAHDRYANIETSYLLQRMEEYEGITILATNLRRNLDDAFARRMAFMITFPLPEEEERLRIWRQVWPIDTPRDAELDLAFMARQFKFSGGNIKNIAVAAAFLAASDGGIVTMRHVVRATKRELQKLGRTPVSNEFGSYSNDDAES
ncbi:ATP-binding protein [Sorangium sp. So ce124]|uniref:ATP-binding protein n=1 Tax=Sorangium sp. So ce124 TaxID=3133280 RepID=UPI003F63854F